MREIRAVGTLQKSLSRFSELQSSGKGTVPAGQCERLISSVNFHMERVANEAPDLALVVVSTMSALLAANQNHTSKLDQGHSGIQNRHALAVDYERLTGAFLDQVSSLLASATSGSHVGVAGARIAAAVQKNQPLVTLDAKTGYEGIEDEQGC